MVMQSEFSTEFVELLNSQSFEGEVGLSDEVTYYDNSLDSVAEDELLTTSSIKDNAIVLTTEVGLTDAVGSDLNSVLVTMNGKALNKAKHTIVSSKKNTERIIYKIKLEFIPNTI